VATVSVDATSVAQGGTVSVSGSGFAPNEKVALELHSDVIVLGEATADAAGSFSTSVTVPGTAPVGDHELVATGADSGRTASSALSVTAADPGTGGGSGAGGGTGSTGSGSGGGASSAGSNAGSLATTGGAFAGFGAVLAGALAIAVGAGLISRRRGRSAD